MVNIIVLMKDIVDLTEIKVDPNTQRPILAGLSRKISDVDKRAVEAAVQLKEKHGGKVTVVSLGDDKTRTALREALAMGGDEAYLLKDPVFDGSDTLATSRILAAAIRKVGGFDLILCGEMTLDSLSAQVGPRISELLELPQVTYARRLELKGDKIVAERDLEDEDEVVEASMPALVAVAREINEPRIPALMNIMKASRKPISEWNCAALGISSGEVGAAGSAVKVLEVKAPPMERKRIIVKAETEEEAAKSLVERLIKDGVLR
jgi:electron transfer flavoprotein beta subunit